MTMIKQRRPDMRDWFAARISWHMDGMLSTRRASYPRGVRRVTGDVTDRLITVTMDDGTEYHWTGGRYSERKIRGCYPPLTPKPIDTPTED